MFDKKDLTIIENSLFKTKQGMLDEINKFWNKELSDEDKKYVDFLRTQVDKVKDLESRIELEKKRTAWFPLIKRAFKKMLLKKMVAWLSEK